MGGRERGLTKLTKFCKLTLDCEIFKNFEKYIRKCPNNFVQNCLRQLVQKFYLWTSYFVPLEILNFRILQLEHFTDISCMKGNCKNLNYSSGNRGFLYLKSPHMSFIEPANMDEGCRTVHRFGILTGLFSANKLHCEL